MHVRDASVWKEAEPEIRDGGIWKQVEEGYVKDGGIWKPFYERSPIRYYASGTAVNTNTISIPIPADQQAGDLMMVVIQNGDGENYSSWPGHYSRIVNHSFGAIFYEAAAEEYEGPDETFTSSDNETHRWAICIIKGTAFDTVHGPWQFNDTTDYVDTVFMSGSNLPNTTAPKIFLAMYAVEGNDTWNTGITVTNPSGLITDVSQTGIACVYGVADATDFTSGISLEHLDRDWVGAGEDVISSEFLCCWDSTK